MKLPTSIPSRMPPASVLRHLVVRPSSESLVAQRTVDGELRPPRIPLRMQQRVNKAALLAGLDPLPSLAQASSKSSSSSSTSTPKIVALPKGSKRDIEKVQREIKVAENMAKMDERIRAWKEEKAKAKQVKRAELPF
ncbi:hypothetical protein BCR33DRAFT_700008 [Rhizoclosmatium globosum]|uniref:Large ribosomal subunit protein mL59 domain-containing protein n=1 Tax=Rhizoclosmatium globosum TaxID=329046 RepID=A0A1Y2BXY2_9FUNG|nr:hypothetical protein BCR33DRAFT_700008 [Rhizoclosmatium globosum]|eukprot:ORY39629.1 hypothetical protein BCR33DRAFT_700008 [Rhizoclosmatium globosum]